MEAKQEEPVDRLLLPVWDQFAIRAYIQLALCFSFDAAVASPAAAQDHIRASLQRLSRQRPELAAKIVGDDQGSAWLERRPSDSIPFRVLQTRQIEGYATYEALKEAGYPQHPFVHPDFAIAGELVPGGPPLPVSRVDVSFMEGGLILWVSVHHTLVDGDSAQAFIDCFAAQTRGEEAGNASNIAPAPLIGVSTETPTQDLYQACPEFIILPQKYGPMVHLKAAPNAAALPDEPNDAVILAFSERSLDKLRHDLEQTMPLSPTSSTRRRPSSHVTLGALVWAHLTKARVTAAERAGCKFDPTALAHLHLAVDWRKRAYLDSCQNYFGNAVAIALAALPLAQVLSGDLAPLAQQIQHTIDAVDEAYVETRTAAMQQAWRARDPRLSGLRHNPADPLHLGFNTWRYLGAGADWRIPGVVRQGPADAIARVGGRIGAAKALIMPMRERGQIELMLWLPRSAMDLVMQDERFTAWIDRVIR